MACQNCKKVTGREEQLSLLSVPLNNPGKTGVTLADRICESLMPEEVLNYECEMCAPNKQRATKSVQITSLPTHLFIRLWRFKTLRVGNGVMYERKTRAINIDTDLLMSSGNNGGKPSFTRYRLTGAVLHRGNTPHGGHYRFISCGTDAMALFDDNTVTVANTAEEMDAFRGFLEKESTILVYCDKDAPQEEKVSMPNSPEVYVSPTQQPGLTGNTEDIMQKLQDATVPKSAIVLNEPQEPPQQRGEEYLTLERRTLEMEESAERAHVVEEEALARFALCSEITEVLDRYRTEEQTKTLVSLCRKELQEAIEVREAEQKRAAEDHERSVVEKEKALAKAESEIKRVNEEKEKVANEAQAKADRLNQQRQEMAVLKGQLHKQDSALAFMKELGVEREAEVEALRAQATHEKAVLTQELQRVESKARSYSSQGESQQRLLEQTENALKGTQQDKMLLEFHVSASMQNEKALRDQLGMQEQHMQIQEGLHEQQNQDKAMLVKQVQHQLRQGMTMAKEMARQKDFIVQQNNLVLSLQSALEVSENKQLQIQSQDAPARVQGTDQPRLLQPKPEQGQLVVHTAQKKRDRDEVSGSDETSEESKDLFESQPQLDTVAATSSALVVILPEDRVTPKPKGPQSKRQRAEPASVVSGSQIQASATEPAVELPLLLGAPPAQISPSVPASPDIFLSQTGGEGVDGERETGPPGKSETDRTEVSQSQSGEPGNGTEPEPDGTT